MSRRPGTPSLLRSINDRNALELLLHDGPLTRVELSKRTGLSKVTASQLLSRLQERDLVEVVGTRSARRGPSAELYAIRPDCSYSIGIEMDPHHVRASLADITGAVVSHVEREVEGTGDPKQLIHDTAADVASQGEIELTKVDEVVIGMPGVVDPVSGDIELSFDLPGWHRGLRHTLAADLGARVSFENDVNLAASAERAEGAGRDVDNMVLLWVGRGVGLAIVLGGDVHHGATGAAGEIGYLPVPGVPSPANIERPAQGALQALVGASAVLELSREHGIVADGAPQAVRAALAGGAAAEGFLRELADRVALGLAAVCAVVDPAVVVVAGETGAAGGDELCARIADAVPHIAPVHPKVVPTGIDDSPILRGAVLAAVDKARQAIIISAE
ncbi:ROK family transcriptional regulator [Phytoactinopolyspora halophila]|uniref:ROK family transcriptional regulator n=1 Tax=Phytoactinopolyspora halophila TaxID=1981511 RepID=UPI001B8C4903|nr:ROK family transcriptional regulator [Phytoactinopolyspora halophila]